MFLRQSILPVVVILVSLCLPGFAKKEKENEKTATISVTVLKAYNGKPIKNAAVVLHSVSMKGKQSSGGLELKTDKDGRASIDSIPYGKLRVQVISQGFQTYGEDVDIAEPEKEITIKMQEPQGQFSIYMDPTPTVAPSPTPAP